MFEKIKSFFTQNSPKSEAKIFFDKVIEPKEMYGFLYFFLLIIIFNFTSLIFYSLSPFISYLISFFELSFSSIVTGFYFLHLYTFNESNLKDFKKGAHELLEIGFVFIIVGIILLFLSLERFLSSVLLHSTTNLKDLTIIQFIVFATVIFLLSTMVRLFFVNKNSKITHSMIIAFFLYSIAWIFDAFYIDYNYSTFLIFNIDQLRIVSPNIKVNYIIFYSILFTGGLFIFNASTELISFNSVIHRKLISLIFISVAIVMLFYSDSGLNYTYYEYILVYMPNLDIVLTFLFIFSLSGPMIYSFFQLQKLPQWITKDRRKWIRSVRLGLILFSLFFIIEGIVNTVNLNFFYRLTSINNIIPLRIYFHLFAIIILMIASFIFLISTYDIERWFFDELKIRSAIELKNIDSSINLSKIWETIDVWQGNKSIPKNEMTENGISLYLKELTKVFDMEPDQIKKL